ncbi:MAG: acyl-ACP--UDP-N-acetylglucosamine O-acyltransferase [Gammaproteobacteria bacterium]|nr:acyl-ACP--UDP-N-acetylglucosamine O-acyltransferase [Gammaproteobacteria bacterium]
MIDTTAIIDPSAKLGANVTIGPYTIIGANVEIGDGTQIGPHAVIKGRTKIGCNNKILQFTSIGEDPQDLSYSGEDTLLEIGDNNVIREFCTFNRGTVKGGGVTRIGNNNLLMAYVHIAHDCILANNIIFANNASLAGHVVIEDYAILSGFAEIAQFCVIGEHSFVAAMTGVPKDVLPYSYVSGYHGKTTNYGLNLVGLRRRGFSRAVIKQLRTAYQLIFQTNRTVKEILPELEVMAETCDAIRPMIVMLEQSTRGIVR